MFCSISGRIPSDPVFSPKTGYIYEKSLILQSLDINGRCPVTNEELDRTADLLSVKSSFSSSVNEEDKKQGGEAEKRVQNHPPRPVTATSVPQLLKTLGGEWDTLMLEVFELRKQLKLTKEELVRTLYERDAACRVIARLTKENETLSKGVVNGEAVSSNGEVKAKRRKEVKVVQQPASMDVEKTDKEPEMYLRLCLCKLFRQGCYVSIQSLLFL